MFKGRYLGIAWNVKDSFCSKILEVHENPKKNCQVFHRSVILMHDPKMAFESPTFKGWKILMLHPWFYHQVISIFGKRMKVNAEGKSSMLIIFRSLRR